jgi:hypothetical protein
VQSIDFPPGNAYDGGEPGLLNRLPGEVQQLPVSKK